MKTIQKNKNLAEEAFDILKNAIITNQLQFDVLYSATELGQMLGGISRTPVREAAQMLEKIGIAKIEKNRGIRILPTSSAMLVESFQIRLMLEVPIIRRVAQLRTDEDVENINDLLQQFHLKAQSNDIAATLEADRDYHLGLLNVLNNQKANDIIANTRNTVLITGASTIPHSRSCMATYQDHLILHQAILDKDVIGAGNAMKQHIINTASLLIQQESTKREDWNQTDLIQQLNWVHP